MRYELSDYEWTAIKPMLRNKPRGVRRINDRRVLNGIFWVLRSGAPWPDLPENYGPRSFPGKDYFVALRLYGPTESFFNQTWRANDVSRRVRDRRSRI
jgi:transposase